MEPYKKNLLNDDIMEASGLSNTSPDAYTHTQVGGAYQLHRFLWLEPFEFSPLSSMGVYIQLFMCNLYSKSVLGEKGDFLGFWNYSSRLLNQKGVGIAVIYKCRSFGCLVFVTRAWIEGSGAKPLNL